MQIHPGEISFSAISANPADDFTLILDFPQTEAPPS